MTTRNRKKELVVSSYYDLLALHRVILEAKFNSNPNDRDISASPIVSKIANDVVSNLIAHDEGQLEHVERWQTWRRIDSSRKEWTVALQRASERSDWDQFSVSEQGNLIRNILAPFEIDEKLEEQFRSDLELIRGA